MIKHFTTPKFADLLKQHGIEIETPFYHCMADYVTSYICVTRNEIYTDFQGFRMGINHFLSIKPAYLLSEVLTWLPKTLIEHLKPTNTPSHRPDYLSYPMVSDIDEGKVLKIGYRSEYYGTKITPKPIEQLITQGLTEGWLTKEIIEQSIKDNQ